MHNDEPSLGPGYRFGPEVTALSPLFLRNLVDKLSTPSREAEVAHLQIHGALELDASPLSIITEAMQAWLKDREASVGRPAQLPFALTEKTVRRGQSLRVVFKTPPDEKQLHGFKGLTSEWSGVISRYPNVAGDAPGSTTFGVQQVTQADAVITTKLTKFLFAPKPAIGTLLGALVLFYERVLAIESVDVQA